MPTPNFIPFATTTFGSNASSVTFSSINQTYGDLILKVWLNTGSSGGITIRFNGDSGFNYKNYIEEANSSQGYGIYTSSSYVNFNYSTNYNNTGSYAMVIDLSILRYASTTTQKGILGMLGNGDYVYNTVGNWTSTSALTSISISTSGTFTAGSAFSLYGISA